MRAVVGLRIEEGLVMSDKPFRKSSYFYVSAHKDRLYVAKFPTKAPPIYFI